ncbi:hypothetical protein [Enterocloster citroniae]|nr:hypothetical protein [Enterocloster citroniae]KMW10425.1 hypothetical protein HMPREF9470_05567 [[Clostridium] citroniae WAL-19142]
MIIIILIVALIILLLIWGIATYNRLITERLKAQTQWSQIDVVLRQWFDLIPNLMETVRAMPPTKRRRCRRLPMPEAAISLQQTQIGR